MSTDRQSNSSTRASAIVDGTVLTGGALRPGQLSIAGDRLVDDVARDARVFDASGLLVLPGIVDLASEPDRPHVVATFVAGRCIYQIGDSRWL